MWLFVHLVNGGPCANLTVVIVRMSDLVRRRPWHCGLSTMASPAASVLEAHTLQGYSR